MTPNTNTSQMSEQMSFKLPQSRGHKESSQLLQRFGAKPTLVFRQLHGIIRKSLPEDVACIVKQFNNVGGASPHQAMKVRSKILN